jgi:small GTP-binding protein
MSKKINVKNDKPIPCKVILVGESGVGKTSIISRYFNRYQEKTESTLGAYFSNKTIIVDGYKINLEIWDTAGQEQYRSINNLFYKDAYICLLVYDITNKITFNCLKDYWYEAVSQNGRKGIIFGVAGNKNDLYEEEDISESEVQEFCNSIDACFKLTSAKVNTSIDDIFLMLGEKFIKSDFMKELIPQYVKEDNESEGQKSNNGSIKLKREDSSNISSDENDIDLKSNNKFLSKGNICC